MKSEKVQSWIYKQLSRERSNLPHENLNREDIEDFTDEFLLDLRAVFENFVKAFNELKRADIESFSGGIDSESVREKLKGSLLLYDLADKKGFMLFRKGYRLIFSTAKPGRIKVHFLKQKPFGETETFVDSSINAITNDTMSINWVHEGHKGFVNINVLVRYYMGRFLQGNVKTSLKGKASRPEKALSFSFLSKEFKRKKK